MQVVHLVSLSKRIACPVVSTRPERGTSKEGAPGMRGTSFFSEEGSGGNHLAYVVEAKR